MAIKKFKPTSPALREMTVFLPDTDTQESIGDVLISLDNKIDLLHRQNQTLIHHQVPCHS